MTLDISITPMTASPLNLGEGWRRIQLCQHTEIIRSIWSAKLMFMNLGAWPYGINTDDKQNPVKGRGGHAVSLYLPLIDAGAFDIGIIINRYRPCEMPPGIAHSCQRPRAVGFVQRPTC